MTKSDLVGLPDVLHDVELAVRRVCPLWLMVAGHGERHITWIFLSPFELVTLHVTLLRTFTCMSANASIRAATKNGTPLF